jgi:ankyrin repeat protein
MCLVSRVSFEFCNARPISEDTPLHLSAQHGHLEICKLLVEYQADVNAKQNGRGPWGTAGSRFDTRPLFKQIRDSFFFFLNVVIVIV